MWNSVQERSQHTALSQETLRLLHQLSTYSESDGQPLISRYSLDYLLSLLDRNRISLMEKGYAPYKDTGMDVTDFLKLLLSIIEHNDSHTFYLSMAAVDLFKEVCSSYGYDKVRFEQVTDFICRRVLDQKAGEFANKKRLLGIRQRLEPTDRVCAVAASPPIIHGSPLELTLKLGRKVVARDRTKHAGQVKKGFYVASMKRILALDGRADHINIYDVNCRLTSKVVPAVSELKRDIFVLGFAYSKRQERIGAALQNFSLSFWDLCETKPFEKSFTTAEQCQQCQQQIWFLENQNVWLTSDNSGLLSSWDLDLEQVEHQLQLKNRGLIATLCELPNLNLIALAQEGHYRDLDLPKSKAEDEQAVICIYNMQKKSLVVEIEVHGSRGGLHTLYFSSEYQVLVAAGYENTMSVFEIDPVYFDATLKGQLIGHQSLVVTFVAVEGTPMIISCDDRQKVKVWDIRSYKCLQTVDFSGRAAIRGLVSLLDVNRVALLGSRIQLLTLDSDGGRNQRLKTASTVCAMRVDFQPSSNELIVFTKEDLRLYDARTGCLKHIFTGYLQPQQEPSSYRYIHQGRLFVVGSSRGELRVYSKESGLMVAQLQPHESDVCNVVYDAANRMFISAGWDSSLLIQRLGKTKPLAYQKIRTIRDNFGRKEINLMEVSFYHGLIAMGCFRQATVLLWDYSTAKLMVVIRMPQGAQPTAIAFINGVGMLIVADTTPKVHLLKLQRKANKLEAKVWLSIPISTSVNHMLVDLGTVVEQRRTMVDHCLVYLAQSNGRIAQLNLGNELGKSPIQCVSKNNNYSAERQINESYINEFNKQFYTLVELSRGSCSSSHPLNYSTKQFEAHKEQITCLSFMEYSSKYLITAATDGHIKAWLNRQLVCDTNLNMPLPYHWQLQPNLERLLQERMLVTLKVIERMLGKYSNEITISKCNGLRVDQFFKVLSEKATFMTQAPSLEEPFPVTLLQDEFTRKDLQYDKIRKYYFREIAGPSLKEMEAKGRMRSIQRMLNQQTAHDRRSEVEEDKYAKANRQQQRKQLVDFLSSKDNNDKDLDRCFEIYTGTGTDTPVRQDIHTADTRTLSKCKSAVGRIRPRRHPLMTKQFETYFEDKKGKENIASKPNANCLSTTAALVYKQPRKARETVTPLTSRERKKKFTWVLNELNKQAFKARNSSSYGRKNNRLLDAPDSFSSPNQIEADDLYHAKSYNKLARTGR